MTGTKHSSTVSPSPSTQLGADAAAAPASGSLKPLIVRVALAALAVLGLSGIGAASMLAGLEGAHATPPAAGSVWLTPSATPATTPATSSPAQASASTAPPSPAPAGDGCAMLTEDGKVILNRADLAALRKLPGIGPKRAEAILLLRAKLKRFRRPADLLRVKGIGPKSLSRMQPHFVVDAPDGNRCESTATAK